MVMNTKGIIKKVDSLPRRSTILLSFSLMLSRVSSIILQKKLAGTEAVPASFGY
jgi:hypothetical protein